MLPCVNNKAISLPFSSTDNVFDRLCYVCEYSDVKCENTHLALSKLHTPCLSTSPTDIPHNSAPTQPSHSSTRSKQKENPVSDRAKKAQSISIMRKTIQKLRIYTDKSPSPPSSTGSSFNRTPPLDPPIAMVSPLPSRDQSRSGTPFSGPRSSSRQSDPFLESNGSPSKGSRFSRFKQSLKDSFAAGIDSEGYHERRRQEAREAMWASGSPTASNRNSQSMTPLSRGMTMNSARTSQTTLSRGRTMDSAPTSQPASRNLSRTATSQSTPTRAGTLNRSISKKDMLHHEKQKRQLDRQASQRRKVKQQREFERGELPAPEGTGSPRYAPLHMLEEANDARIQAEERRRSLEDRRQKYNPSKTQTPENRSAAYGTNTPERAPTQTPRSSSRRREPEYDKRRDKRRAEPQAARDPEPAMESESDIEYAVQNAYQPRVADGPLQVTSSTSTSTRQPAAGDINPYHWDGLQPRAPSPSEYTDASVEEDKDPFYSPPRQNWGSSSHQNQSQNQIQTQNGQIRSSSSSLYSQEGKSGLPSEYNPWEEWFNPQLLRTNELKPEPEPRQPRGEHEMIINRMTMPDQEGSRQERDTYHAHVTRRMRGPAGREFF